MLQAAKAASAITITAGTNQPETWSASRWIGARERCAAATICTMRDSMVSRPTFSARMMKLPVVLSVPRDDLRAHLLGHRHGFARDHRLVDRRAAFDQLAIDRDLLARAHPEPIADGDGVERHFLVAAVGLQAPRRLGREIEQGADRARGLLARAQLEHLAEQDENGDDGGGFEIDGDRAVRAAKGRREQAGQQDRDDAVEPRHAGAHRDQREHVQVAGEERLPAAHEERPARPQHHRRGEHELQPVRPVLAEQHVEIGEVAAHFERDDRQRERKPDPEPARHVGKLGIGRRLRRRPAPARAPCRRSGRSRGRPAGSADASGRYRSCPPARTAAIPPSPERDISPDRRRICPGSRPSRNNRSAPRAARDEASDAGRPSCRRPDPARLRRRRRAAYADARRRQDGDGRRRPCAPERDDRRPPRSSAFCFFDAAARAIAVPRPGRD